MKKEKLIITIILLLCIISIGVGIYSILLRKDEIAEEALFPKTLLPEKKKIGVVHIYGMISFPEDASGFYKRLHGTEDIIRQLKKFQKDDSICAVILKMNSPGGTVAAVQEIYQQVQNLKKAKKKVVVSIGDIATSGAYYIACAADKIVANHGSLTGSIGVLMSLPNIEGFLEKVGVKFNIIKSGTHKDIGSAFRGMSEEEKSLLQGVIDNAYHQFFNVVAKNRTKIEKEKLIKIADGRIFTGEQAKEAGLIDELGTYEEAIKLTAKLANIEGEPVIVEEERAFKRLLDFMEIKNLFEKLQEDSTKVRLEYRYIPIPQLTVTNNGK
ncbi:MAG: signal peptide peptidase SppA [bacterium]